MLWQVRCGTFRIGKVGYGAIWYGLAGEVGCGADRCNWVWCGLAGMFWTGKVRRGPVWYGTVMYGRVCRGKVWQVRFGQVGLVLVRQGQVG